MQSIILACEKVRKDKYVGHVAHDLMMWSEFRFGIDFFMSIIDQKKIIPVVKSDEFVIVKLFSQHVFIFYERHTFDKNPWEVVFGATTHIYFATVESLCVFRFKSH